MKKELKLPSPSNLLLCYPAQSKGVAVQLYINQLLSGGILFVKEIPFANCFISSGRTADAEVVANH